MSKKFPQYFWLSPKGNIIDVSIMSHEKYITGVGYELPTCFSGWVSAPTNCPLFLMGLTSGQATNLVVPTNKTQIQKTYIFIKKLGTVMTDFQKDMEKPENQPKPFGKGPPEYSQWIGKDDVKNGRLKWVIDNYGDFWLIIKWSYSPRQQIKASELLKNYDQIIYGREQNKEYAREIFVRKEPFQGI